MNFKNLLQKCKNGFLDALFPDGVSCVCCNKELSANTRDNLCAECMEDVLSFSHHRCQVCGVEIKNEADYCTRCMNFDRFFEKNRSPLKYEGVGEKLIKKLKFGGKLYVAEELAKLMCDEYINESYCCDLVCYVPMSDSEKKKRGFNQAELLAEHISKRLNLPLKNALIKTKDTSDQKHLLGKERRENLKGVFSVIAPQDIKGKTVVLIDDVFTTGATVNECSRTLKKAGAKGIYALTACVTQFAVEGEKNQDFQQKS